MKYVCEKINIIDSEDEKFLLDDSNTNEYINFNETNGNNIFTKWNESSDEKTFEWLQNNNINDSVAISNSLDCDNSTNNFNSVHIPLLVSDRLDDGYEQHREFHCHSNQDTYSDAAAWKKLIVVSLICIILMTLESIGGCIAGSLAVMTDAAHLLTDLIGFCISIISLWLSKKAPNKIMTFGYSRYEVMGALLSVLTVWLLAGIFCYLALHRLIRKEYEVNADTMIIVASIGVMINIVMASVLHGSCSGHNHGHNHDHMHGNNNTTNSKENINVRAAAAHVIGDLCQSFGVLIAAVIIKIFPGAQAADPVCTLLFSIVAICATLRIARDVGKILLEASPDDLDDLMHLLKKIPKVRHVHEMHLWSLAPGREVLNVHLAVDKNSDRDDILEKATNLVNIKTSIISCTIQIENYKVDSINSCERCQLFN